MNETALPSDAALPVLLPSRVSSMAHAGAVQKRDCPACGGAMALRTARSGPRSGLDYWGCVNFPGCRGTINIGGAPGFGEARPAVPEGAGGSTSMTPGAATASRPAVGPGPLAQTGSRTAPVASPTGGATAGGATAGATAAGVTRSALQAAAHGATLAVGIARPAVVRAANGAVELAIDILRPSVAPASGGGHNVAGASAQAEFERRRARHRMKMRAALPLVVGATLIVMVLLFVALGRLGPIPALVGLALAAAVGLVIMASLPADALAWRRGASGERRTAEHLDQLVEEGYVVLHDRLIPGLRANIDHIAVGPAGVFAIETKSLRGRLSIVGDKLFAGDRTHTGILDQTLREALAVQVALADRLNALRATVRPVVCIQRTPQLLLDNDVQGVRVVSASELVRFLRGQPALFDPETVQELAALADTRLRAALP